MKNNRVLRSLSTLASWSLASRGILGILMLGIGAPLWAVSIPIANPGFEADVLPCAGGPLCFHQFDVPGWNATGGGTTFKPSTGPGGEYPGGIPEGVNVLALGDPSLFGETSQDLGFAPTPNSTYTLSVYVGQRGDAPLTAYFVELLVGTTVVASDSSLKPAPGHFLLDTVTYKSGASPGGQDLVIALGASGGGQANFDEVTLNGAISAAPEPGAAAFVVLGLAALGLWRRLGIPLR